MQQNNRTSFYSEQELKEIGFKSLGRNVKVSQFARFYGVKNISLGNNVRIDDFCILSGNIDIGSYVHIASFSALFGSGGIEIYDFAGLSSKVTIYSASDDYLGDALTGPCIPDEYRKVESGKVELMKHALIGASSVVLPNTILREGAVVGAMSLAKGDILEWSIFAGVPAKFIKSRKKEIIISFENEILNNGEL